MFLLLEPPDNRGYMVAAYVVVATVLLLYAMALMRRGRNEERRER